jgi:hypothetical protein
VPKNESNLLNNKYMKNVTRFFIIAAIVSTMTAVFTSCKNTGNKISDGDKVSESNKISDSNRNVGNGGFLADNSNYFAIVDGVRYDANTKIQKILDDGHTTYSTSNLNLTIKPGTKTINDYGMIKDKGSRFRVNVINRTNEPLTVTDCTIYDITLQAAWYSNISIVGGLSFSSSREDILKFFSSRGLKPSSNNATTLSFSQQTSSGTPILSGNFLFSFRDGDKLWSIIMVTNR